MQQNNDRELSRASGPESSPLSLQAYPHSLYHEELDVGNGPRMHFKRFVKGRCARRVATHQPMRKSTRLGLVIFALLAFGDI